MGASLGEEFGSLLGNSLGTGSVTVGGSGGSSDVSSNGEVPSEVSEKGASMEVEVDAGTLVVGADADVVAVAEAAQRSSFPRLWVWPRRTSVR